MVNLRSCTVRYLDRVGVQRSVRAPFATSIVWAFNVWGAVDLLVAFYQGLIGVRIGPGSLGAAYFIPTVVVPPLLVTHGLMFWLLLRKPSSAPS
jgi:hypothetical protein